MRRFIIDTLATALFVGFTAWIVADREQHDIAAHFYAKCREDLGLFEPMTTLEKGRSACAARIETELGIVNRWTEELP